MKRVLILGSSGMAGHVVTMFLERSGKYKVHNLSHRMRINDSTILMDVSDFDSFNNYLDSNSFDIIINCIGILNGFAEDRKDYAVLLNSYLPHYLEYKYMNSYTKIIHLSTDCVFSGKTGNYNEGSFRDGDSFYDRTKIVGEVINNKDLTFRTSIIGPDISYNGIGLFNWFMKSKGEINGYVNAIWTGITTFELAKAIDKAIQSDLTGLYHLVSEESINKFDLLNLFNSIFNRSDISIKKYENEYINKSLINTRKDFGYVILSYSKMIQDMKEWILEYKVLYPHYFDY